MENFDADKIKDMEYDPSRGRYVAKDGREFKSTLILMVLAISMIIMVVPRIRMPNTILHT